ncbi:uncharacterized protein B0H18DRAFT_889860 [Fomitopsis serialis]|uniref:uncharacterized protein n=1 Tax=Fomitopsis serialis TaxID=139415 RepID=UPI00200879B3|nr:uncharacterized protein B0H18DRAFT_889860 [Neoantrodia serialis]KAH9912518.1 hypothetical protein B0H18DRAFT_889860 [Neoantrodia serialis]
MLLRTVETQDADNATLGKSFLRESRRMTEEPRPLNSASSPFLLIDPAVLRTLTTSKSTTDIRHSSDYSPAQNGTQTDQDETDEENRKNAMKELMKSWMDRLQLISVITTFFAATETQLLVITTPAEDNTPESRVRSTANAILAGALVIHLCAVRYRLKEAAKEEIKIETGITPTSSKSALKTGIWTANPHLEEMGPFRRGGPPTRLLEHLHTLCMWLALVGFALALAGALCYTWARLSRSASIFASVCMAVSWLAALGAVFIAL